MATKETVRAVDPVLEEVRKATVIAAAEDAAAKQALGNPLPGPLKQALAISQEIPVGPWKIRPLCDGDFEVLVELDHPIRKIMEVQFEMAFRGKAPENDVGFDCYTPRGPSMWQLAWMMTRPAKTVMLTIRTGTIAALKNAAENEFYAVPTPVLVQIYMAIASQISTCWSTAMSYGPSKGGDAAADATGNPSITSSAQELTALGGV